jgi:hypothetical protein
MRTTVTLALTMITSSALIASLGHLGALQYWLGLIVLLVAIGIYTLAETFDLYALSAAALGANVLIVVGVGHLLFKGSHGGDAIGMLLLLGLVAAGLLAATVSGILRLARRRAAPGEGA